MIAPDGVILSYCTDEHALAVLSVLPSTYRPLLVDVGLEGVEFVTSVDNAGRIALKTRNGTRFDLSDVKFWWNRRPRFRPQDATQPSYAQAQEADVTHFWMGIFGMAPGGHWCNPPKAHAAAQNKLTQLFLARQCGLRTPRTLWSNDPVAIEDFWQTCRGRAAIKMFEGSEHVWQPTRLLTRDDLQWRDHFRFAHSIFQEIVDGDLEYRVVIFGDYVFAVTSNVGGSRYPYDTRIDTATERIKFTPSAALISALREFRSRSGLSYCAFDIRENRSGEPIFLENNPMGQFLYLDHAFDGEILRAFAAFMIEQGSNGKIDCQRTARIPQWEGGIDVPYFAASGDLVTHIID